MRATSGARLQKLGLTAARKATRFASLVRKTTQDFQTEIIIIADLKN
jgi:hypothetical protein